MCNQNGSRSISNVMNILKAKKNKDNQKGFLIVEMIVSVALFSIVMLISTGSLLVIIDANKKAQAFKTIVNNINLAMESMSRDIRVGFAYNCGNPTGGDCASGNDILFFKNELGLDMVYRLFGGSLQKYVDGRGFVNVTANDIFVENLTFYVFGSEGITTDTRQPLVIVVIKGYALNKGERMDFGLQTAISQRLLDL